MGYGSIGIFSNPAIPKGERTMSRILSLTGFALAFLCMSVSVRVVWAQAVPAIPACAGGNKPAGGNMPSCAPVTAPRPAGAALIWDVCWVRGADIQIPQQMGQAVFYVSGALPLFSLADYQDVPKAFAKFNANKLPTGMTAAAACVQFQSQAEALSWIKEYVTNLTNPARVYAEPNCKRNQCIMTDWTTPERPAAEVAAAPAPAIPPCAGGNKPAGGNMPCGVPATAPARPAAPAPPDPCVISGVGLATAPPAGCRPAPPAARVAPVVPAAVNPPPRASNQPAGAVVAPAPAAKQMPYAICQATMAGLTTMYFSAPFEAPVPNYQAWSLAFKAFLKQYNFQGNVGCNIPGSLAEAQQRLKVMGDAYRSTRKVVQTDWKYE
jgi:hypothetical protein